jgi:patatin-like phospholipase/acyl hydrolase
MAAPTGTHKELPKAASKPKTLLALDGGGVKGISTLILLQAIMDEVKRQEGGEGDERKPVDYFDLAAGTSTGGLIALMLFRLHMSTSQVINVYHARAQDIFWPTFLGIPLDKVPLGHWLGFTILLKIKTLFTGQEFSNDGLKDVIDDVVKEYGLSPAERMKGGKADLVFDQSVGNEESGIGKTSGNM